MSLADDNEDEDAEIKALADLCADPIENDDVEADENDALE